MLGLLACGAGFFNRKRISTGKSCPILSCLAKDRTSVIYVRRNGP